jgi:hypothetical protein
MEYETKFYSALNCFSKQFGPRVSVLTYVNTAPYSVVTLLGMKRVNLSLLSGEF